MHCSGYTSMAAWDSPNKIFFNDEELKRLQKNSDESDLVTYVSEECPSLTSSSASLSPTSPAFHPSASSSASFSSASVMSSSVSSGIPVNSVYAKEFVPRIRSTKLIFPPSSSQLTSADDSSEYVRARPIRGNSVNAQQGFTTSTLNRPSITPQFDMMSQGRRLGTGAYHINSVSQILPTTTTGPTTDALSIATGYNYDTPLPSPGFDLQWLSGSEQGRSRSDSMSSGVYVPEFVPRRYTGSSQSSPSPSTDLVPYIGGQDSPSEYLWDTDPLEKAVARQPRCSLQTPLENLCMLMELNSRISMSRYIMPQLLSTPRAVLPSRPPVQPEPHNVCHFCKRNGERRALYTSHSLRSPSGVVTCPILRRYVCPICSATGDNAHTVSYCPQGNGVSTVTTIQTPRKGCGCHRNCRHTNDFKRH